MVAGYQVSRVLNADQLTSDGVHGDGLGRFRMRCYRVGRSKWSRNLMAREITQSTRGCRNNRPYWRWSAQIFVSGAVSARRVTTLKSCTATCFHSRTLAVSDKSRRARPIRETQLAFNHCQVIAQDLCQASEGHRGITSQQHCCDVSHRKRSEIKLWPGPVQF